MKQQFETICNRYIKAFEQKHDYYFDYWVADQVGTIACFGDYFIDFEQIRYDIDNDVPRGKFIEFYDAQLDWAMIRNEVETLIDQLKEYRNKPYPNYHHWLKGCPTPTEEELNELKASVERSKKLLVAILEETNKNEKPK